jgi:hypothetical protein
MDAFDSVNFTSGQLEDDVISTPPNDLPVNGQTGTEDCFPCVIA